MRVLIVSLLSIMAINVLAAEPKLCAEFLAQLTPTRWKSYAIQTMQQQPRKEAIAGIDLLGNRVSNSSILDVGAGSGNESMLFLSKGAHVTAVDIDPSSLAILSERARLNGFSDTLESINSAAESLRFEKTFDLFHSSLALPFIPQAKFLETWSNLSKSVKTGGYFSGSFFGPNHEWRLLPSGEVNTQMSFYDESSIRKIFEDSGFKILSLENVERPTPTANGRTTLFHTISVQAEKL